MQTVRRRGASPDDATPRDEASGAQQVALGLQHLDRGGRERGLPNDLYPFNLGPVVPATTASNISCMNGDGVWCTISSVLVTAEPPTRPLFSWSLARGCGPRRSHTREPVGTSAANRLD